MCFVFVLFLSLPLSIRLYFDCCLDPNHYCRRDSSSWPLLSASKASKVVRALNSARSSRPLAKKVQRTSKCGAESLLMVLPFVRPFSIALDYFNVLEAQKVRDRSGQLFFRSCLSCEIAWG